MRGNDFGKSIGENLIVGLSARPPRAIVIAPVRPGPEIGANARYKKGNILPAEGSAVSNSSLDYLPECIHLVILRKLPGDEQDWQ
jgi:hypothetical protein